jgi:CTP:molybdopterin cytidylyltransferase MocA
MKAKLLVEYHEETGNVLVIAEEAGIATAITTCDPASYGILASLKELVEREHDATAG